ncbi:MAG: N-acetylmuramoyl-L-alanine amidase [Robiginitomaculum sp.]|nr:MAG: N-acetylmuramoyl-L-alanine amidase [Robiginitomaculum sp.]
MIDAPSPNHNERDLPVTMLVLHYTGMKSGAAAIERLRDPAAKVSAHYVLEEDGRIFQLVDENQRAWHAGVSFWRSITDINSASIGIEIVNGGHDFGLPAFPEVLMQALVPLCQGIIARHNIAAHNIVGHSDIAPGRKQDPGERFAWDRLAREGIGLWPTPTEPPPETNLFDDLAHIGYGLDLASETEIITAFQRRYCPQNPSGKADAQTRALAHALAQMIPSP